MKVSRHFCTALLLVASASGFAQSLVVKPGLWEHSVNMTSESGRLEQALQMARAQMALMPPEQRQMIENMLAQQGVKMDFANQTFQNCISEEEAANGEFNWQQDAQCEQSTVSNVGGETHVKFVCGQGEGELVMQNDSQYTGNSRMTLDFNGNTELVTVAHSGKWVGGNCGALAQ